MEIKVVSFKSFSLMAVLLTVVGAVFFSCSIDNPFQTKDELISSARTTNSGTRVFYSDDESSRFVIDGTTVKSVDVASGVENWSLALPDSESEGDLESPSPVFTSRMTESDTGSFYFSLDGTLLELKQNGTWGITLEEFSASYNVDYDTVDSLYLSDNGTHLYQFDHSDGSFVKEINLALGDDSCCFIKHNLIGDLFYYTKNKSYSTPFGQLSQDEEFVTQIYCVDKDLNVKWSVDINSDVWVSTNDVGNITYFNGKSMISLGDDSVQLSNTELFTDVETPFLNFNPELNLITSFNKVCDFNGLELPWQASLIPFNFNEGEQILVDFDLALIYKVERKLRRMGNLVCYDLKTGEMIRRFTIPSYVEDGWKLHSPSSLRLMDDGAVVEFGIVYNKPVAQFKTLYYNIRVTE